MTGASLVASGRSVLPLRSRSMDRGLPDIVIVGRVVRPHGLAGEVVVETATDVDERFERGLDAAAGRRPDVASRWPGRDRSAIDCWSASRACRIAPRSRGCAGSSSRWSAARCRARRPGRSTTSSCSTARVTTPLWASSGWCGRIHEDGGGVLLEIALGERRLLVPFVDAFVVRIDVAARRIDLDLPPGLVDVCAST